MINEIWNYLKNPTYSPYSLEEKENKWRIFREILILNLVSSFLLGLFIALITSIIKVDIGEHGINELFKKFSVYIIFLLGVLVAPILEELIFRAPLGFFKNSKYFKVAFYCSFILFGAVHITNFTSYKDFLWLAPLLVLPQTVAGIFLGFIRVKLGLGWSMLLHACHNGILFAPILFIKFTS